MPQGRWTGSVPRKRVGDAGVVAAAAMAVAGVLAGGLSAYIGEFGATARLKEEAIKEAIIAQADAEALARAVLVADAVKLADPERFAPPRLVASAPIPRPKVVIIIDDMGLNESLARETAALPGPLTLSYLPYAHNVDSLAKSAKRQGNDIMLHLPMEPEGEADPGPRVLRSDATGSEFLSDLNWNLSRFSGYAGVNNHMGSQLTTDPAAMKTVLAELKARGLFFLDSVTTSDSVARSAGARVGATVLSRDVFLDDTPGDPELVKKQLAAVEEIAKATGYAIAIGHPRRETLDVLGPWLATAPARGFDILSISALLREQAAPMTPPRLRY